MIKGSFEIALAAWHSGHRVRHQNRRSQVRIPPGCKVFWNVYIAMLLSWQYIICIVIVCTLEKWMLKKGSFENKSLFRDLQISTYAC
jgi:hypothetical protein